MLKIENLHASVDGKDILRGLGLTIQPGEVHAIMGPNGSGKSTLGHILAGRPGYDVTEGSVTFEGQDLLEMETEDRAREGIFLAFQYPVEIPGVSNMEFLKASVDAVREHRGLPALDAVSFMKSAREACKAANLPSTPTQWLVMWCAASLAHSVTMCLSVRQRPLLDSKRKSDAPDALAIRSRNTWVLATYAGTCTLSLGRRFC